jgi:hypothetical protein
VVKAMQSNPANPVAGMDSAGAPSAGVDSDLPPWPLAVARGSDTDWTAAPSLVDGDTNTLWTGNADATSWTIALDFEESISLKSLNIVYEGGPWPEVVWLGTDNMLEWFDLEQVSAWPVSCRAIYLIFRGDGSGTIPVIREIQWEGDLPLSK